MVVDWFGLNSPYRQDSAIRWIRSIRIPFIMEWRFATEPIDRRFQKSLKVPFPESTQSASHSPHKLEGPAILDDHAFIEGTTGLQSSPRFGDSDEKQCARLSRTKRESSRFAKVERRRTQRTACLNLLQGESTPGCRMPLSRDHAMTDM